MRIPPYFGMHLQRKTGRLPENYVAQIYSTIMDFGCPFKSGYGLFHEDATFEEIVAWNQAKLQQGFKLGYTEHCRNDYMQILFDAPPDFSEMRGFWSYWESQITFNLIIPEDDIFDCEGSEKIREAKISYLRTLGIRFWESGLVHVIQTSLEADGYYDIERVLAGEGVVTRPYAILPKDALKNFKNTYFEGMADVGNNGVMIEMDKDLWNRRIQEADREYMQRRHRRY